MRTKQNFKLPRAQFIHRFAPIVFGVFVGFDNFVDRTGSQHKIAEASATEEREFVLGIQKAQLAQQRKTQQQIAQKGGLNDQMFSTSRCLMGASAVAGCAFHFDSLKFGAA